MAIIGSFLPCIFAGTKSVLKIIVTMVSCLNTAWLNDYAWGRDKLLMCFLKKDMMMMNFYRKEGYILWQSRCSPFNFQNLCFFCKIKGPYNSIIKYRQCGQILPDRVYGQTKLQNDSCAEFYDTLNTEFKLTVKMQILGRSTALTLLSKSQISWSTIYSLSSQHLVIGKS